MMERDRAHDHWEAGELFPRVGFIVTNMALPSRSVVRFYNRRGTAEQWIREGHWTRLSCHRFRANEVRVQLSVLAYNLRTPLAAADAAQADRNLVTSPQQRRVRRSTSSQASA